jgi:uncharacterized protein HemX
VTELIEKQEQDVGKSKKARWWFRSEFWLGIIILCVAGAGFFLFWQLRSQQDNLGGELNKGDMQVIELSKQISGYQTQLAAIQSQLATVEADVAAKDEHFTKTLAEFSQLHGEKLDSTRNELNGTIQQIQRQLGKTRGDWLIADAEYLLSIANQRLYLMADVNTTREALEAADQRLRESGDGGVFKIREQIAKDIAAIRGIAVADVVGIYSSVQTLQDNVDQLALLLPYSGKSLTPAKEEVQPKPADKDKDKEQTGNKLIDSAMEQLEGMVTIRHTEHPIKEILTPEEAQFIREQLRVKLEMVKIALVQQNEALYLSGLADAKKWTEQNFTKNAGTASFIAELDKFSAIKIRSQFPDISLSLKMLQDITKLRLEADKAIQPSDTAKSTQAEKPVETAKPVEAEKPAETAKPAEAAPAAH